MNNLGFDISFEELNSLAGLKKLDQEFLQFIGSHDGILQQKLLSLRASHTPNSDILIKLSELLDDFIGELFGVELENFKFKEDVIDLDLIYEARRKFVQREYKKYSHEELTQLETNNIEKKLIELIGELSELNLAKSIIKWLKDHNTYSRELKVASEYCALMVHQNSTLSLFDIPRPQDSYKIREYKIAQLSQDISLGFEYRDNVSDHRLAHMQSHYCIHCHKQQKDSCSKGLDQEQEGCPLDEKISEMNLLKSRGFNIGALAMIIVDNPMVAATGHRICNDCMKACIFQKQDPVNVPYVESNVLESVLTMPWGVEIYILLTKWNPLNILRPYAKEPSGFNILVAGLGPAGFTLSYQLLQQGHNVVAIDGLKILPLKINCNLPIRNWQEIKENLSDRVPQGFGGVMEYGITNRWDKNYLTLIRLILERHTNFSMHGGLRLGGNITAKQAFDYGFNHIALCLGAGPPSYENLPGYFAKGVKSAADFLMNLQQGVPYQLKSNSNLLLRPPFVIIGLGLTAIDAAVELMHYYPIHVENLLQKWENGAVDHNILTKEELEIAEELIAHAKLFKDIKAQDKIKIIKDLGGVTICYRRSIPESPAYRLNHEEIEHALAIGIDIKENLVPTKISQDQYGYSQHIEFSNGSKINAKTILIATGTADNQFSDIEFEDNISKFGDCAGGKSAGSVVRAIASAASGCTKIEQSLREQKSHLVDRFKNDIISTIKQVNYLSDDIVELIVHSPLAVKNFQPGQFFKLQNMASDIDKITEPLALTGAFVDHVNETISLIVLEVGRSSGMCRNLKPGEKISLMGPTGTPSKILQNKTVALIGGGLGNAVLIAVGQDLQKNGCKVLYFAGYKNKKDRFYHDKIEQFSNTVFWSLENGVFDNVRAQDYMIRGNIIDAINLANNEGLLSKLDHVMCIGSDSMMGAVAKNKQLFGGAEIICSMNSPMQCMMKGICGQCIQQVDNNQGYIFACACQDQDINIVNFESLGNRLKANSLLEKTSKLPSSSYAQI